MVITLVDLSYAVKALGPTRAATEKLPRPAPGAQSELSLAPDAQEKLKL